MAATGPESAAVEGDEVHVDKAVADDEIVVERELEGGADPVVGVEADAVAIAGEDEGEVERALAVAQRREEALVQELVGGEGEATGDAADPDRGRWGEQPGPERKQLRDGLAAITAAFDAGRKAWVTRTPAISTRRATTSRSSSRRPTSTRSTTPHHLPR
jgi:hypothetical protein